MLHTVWVPRLNILENPLEHDPRDLAEEAGISKSSCYEYIKEDKAARTVLQ